MKQYVIDELRPDDFEKIKAHLDQNFGTPAVEHIYWIQLPTEVLDDIQIQHDKCGPFFFAIDLEPDIMACELLVRTKNKVHCDCIGYATVKQRNWFINFVDSIFKDLDIIV